MDNAIKYAFLKNNIVQSVYLFSPDVSENFLDLIKTEQGFDLYMLTENAGVGWELVENQLRPLKPYNSFTWSYEKNDWIAPIPKPENPNVFWNEDLQEWIDFNAI